MAIDKTPVNVINNVTIAANNKAEQAVGTDISSAINLKVGFSVTFNASATYGAKVELYADPADATASFTIGAYDVPIDSEDILITSANKGHAVGGNAQMNWSPKYVKVRIVNMDPVYSITAASAWLTPQRP